MVMTPLPSWGSKCAQSDGDKLSEGRKECAHDREACAMSAFVLKFDNGGKEV